MSNVPYAHITQGPAIIRPYGPPVVVKAPRRFNPLLPLCCIGLILFLIAATIILALIPLYLSTKGDSAESEIIPFTTEYGVNNGTLPIGPLSSENCNAIQNDLTNFAASNNGISPVTPIVTQCTVTGNTTTTTGRRRRQSQRAVGNKITVTGYCKGKGECRRGRCLRRRTDLFIQLLLTRGVFFLIFIGVNGAPVSVSTTIISGSTSSAQTFTSTQTPTTTQYTSLLNDIAILNYALVLEQLESSFYTRYQGSFTAQDFIAANYTQETYTYFNLIASHEQAHVRILTSVINQLGGTPVTACTYNFSSVTDAKSYVAVAKALENTGTMAYDGAVNGIADTRLREVASTIATVEARHASYLNYIQGVSPFPTAFENATAPAIVIQAIQPFIVSCPYTITAPTVPYIGSSSYTGTVPTTNNTSVSPYTSAMYVNDLRALNYALTAEHLESTFYNTYVSNFTSSDYTSNGFSDASMYYIMIREIENAHVSFLQTTITQRGGTPVSVCSYNFNVTDVEDFITLSRTFENTGVSAYDGAINTISDPNIILGAATIATVEARFASYVNLLSKNVPFPNVTDPTLTPTQVVTALSAYQTCPYTPDLPVVLNPSTLNINIPN